MARIDLDCLVRCPFFEDERGAPLLCEGSLKNTLMTTRFQSAAEKRRHMEACCFLPDGGDCPLAKACYRRYEEEEP